MARRCAFNPLLKSYPDSERINSVSEGAEVLYTRLIAASDDEGRYYGDPKWVLARLFTSRMLANQIDLDEVEYRLCELDRIDLIRRYDVDGVPYIQMVEVFKKLRADVAKDARFPTPKSAPISYTERKRTGDVTYSERPRNENVPETVREEIGGESHPVSMSEQERSADGSSTQPNPTQPNYNPTQSSRPKFSFEPEDMELAQWMFGLIRELHPNQREPNFPSWANTIRLMRERDARAPPDIRSLFEWANNDTFWKANILSPETLREKWDQLSIKRKHPGERRETAGARAGFDPSRQGGDF